MWVRVATDGGAWVMACRWQLAYGRHPGSVCGVAVSHSQQPDEERALHCWRGGPRGQPGSGGVQWLEDMHVVIVLGSVGGCTGRLAVSCHACWM